MSEVPLYTQPGEVLQQTQLKSAEVYKSDHANDVPSWYQPKVCINLLKLMVYRYNIREKWCGAVRYSPKVVGCGAILAKSNEVQCDTRQKWWGAVRLIT